MAGSLVGKGETILVVDDAEVVLSVVVSILKAAHFDVLQASNGPEALKLAANYAGKIDVLLSDIQMPEMSGPTLGETLKEARPDILIMLMSGFPGGDLLVLNYGWAFIQKPFVPVKLLEMINVVLHTPNKSQGSHQYDTRIQSGGGIVDVMERLGPDTGRKRCRNSHGEVPRKGLLQVPR